MYRLQESLAPFVIFFQNIAELGTFKPDLGTNQSILPGGFSDSSDVTRYLASIDMKIINCNESNQFSSHISIWVGLYLGLVFRNGRIFKIIYSFLSRVLSLDSLLCHDCENEMLCLEINFFLTSILMYLVIIKKIYLTI